MIVLTGETGSARNVALLQQHGWGRVYVDKRPQPYPFEPWAFDNRAFIAWKNNTPWSAGDFLRRLDVAAGCASDPYMAVTPDIVAAGLRSLEFSLEWKMRLREYDFPWYLAVQDGMGVEDVRPHLHLFQGLFLGGSDRFKATAYRWSALAHSYQLKFHYGRASTPGKLAAAFRSNADSCDSSFPLWTTERMQTFIWRWQGLKEQTTMEFGV